jgi:hypothetical protein
MLFQALTGRLPHEGPDVRALLAAKFLPPPPIRDLVPSLSPRVASVIDALLIANPEKRPGSASEVARALAERPSEAPASIWPDRLTRSEMPLSVAETSDLFWPSHGFASVAEDAGALLHALTGGDRLRLRQELERWLSDRVVRWELGPGSRIVIDRFSLDRLEARRRLKDSGSAADTPRAVALARNAAEEGRLGLASAMLQELLWRSPRPPIPELETILSLAVEVALAEGAPERSTGCCTSFVGGTITDTCRAWKVRGATPSGPVDRRALDLASLEPLEAPPRALAFHLRVPLGASIGEEAVLRSSRCCRRRTRTRWREAPSRAGSGVCAIVRGATWRPLCNTKSRRRRRSGTRRERAR